MFPIIGLFVFLIPAAGLVIGMGLLLIRRTRFLAPFAFLVPLLGGVGAATGLFALGIAAERMGVPWWLVALATWGWLVRWGSGGRHPWHRLRHWCALDGAARHRPTEKIVRFLGLTEASF
jgi:hypothetical protein